MSDDLWDDQRDDIEALREHVGLDPWQSAALRVGEELASSGPDGYYGFTPEQWRNWCLFEFTAVRLAREQAEQERDRLRIQLEDAWWLGRHSASRISVTTATGPELQARCAADLAALSPQDT
jgi:hypothetical protein